MIVISSKCFSSICMLLLLSSCITPELNTCRFKDDFSLEELDDLSKSGEDFISYIQNESYNSLEEQLHPDLLAIISDQTINSYFVLLADELDSINGTTSLDQVYLLKSSSPEYVLCQGKDGTLKNGYYVNNYGSLSGSLILVYNFQTLEGAHDILFLQFLKDAENYKLGSFYLSQEASPSYSYEDISALAEEQSLLGNQRNVYFLYSLSTVYLVNNNIMYSSKISEIQEKISSFDLESLSFVPDGFTIYKITPIIVGEDIALQFHYVTDSISDIETLQNEADTMAQAIDDSYPEYKEFFDGFVFTAVEDLPKEGEIIESYNTVVAFDETK